MQAVRELFLVDRASSYYKVASSLRSLSLITNIILFKLAI
jgi:hypothetical protein